MAIAVAVFALTLALILGGYWMFVLRLEDADARALRKRLKTPRIAKAIQPMVRDRERLSAVGAIDTLLVRSESWFAPAKDLILRSGANLTLGALVLATVFLFLVGFLLGFYFTSLFLVGVAIGLMLAVIPTMYLKRQATKRITKFEDLFPEAIDLMARALRAGHALTTALQMVGEEIPEPVAGEFKLLFDRQNFGMSLPEAMREFGARVPLVDARFFVTAVLTQRETGGNLSEILDNLATVIRERFKVKRQVRVVSAHGRITGWVLGFLPPALALILFTLSPALMRLLIDDPLGRQMLGIALVLQVIGVLAIRKIVDVEY